MRSGSPSYRPSLAWCSELAGRGICRKLGYVAAAVYRSSFFWGVSFAVVGRFLLWFGSVHFFVRGFKQQSVFATIPGVVCKVSVLFLSSLYVAAGVFCFCQLTWPKYMFLAFSASSAFGLVQPLWGLRREQGGFLRRAVDLGLLRLHCVRNKPE